MFSLEGKIGLVTGSSRGLGAGIARMLALAGADVVVNYRRGRDQADSVVREIQTLGHQSFAVQADVGCEAEVSAMFAAVMARFGRLDILVNNAGTTRDEDIFATTLESWQSIIDTNLTGTFLCSKYAMEIMRAQGSGRIINISSIVAHRGALYGHVHYAATKAGQLGFTKTLARTGAPLGITVNAVAPGLTATELLFETHEEEEIARLEKLIPLGLGTVEEVGYAVVFLASDEARHITGATLDINGGMYMR